MYSYSNGCVCPSTRSFPKILDGNLVSESTKQLVAKRYWSIEVHQIFRGTYCFHLQCRREIQARNVLVLLPNYTTFQHRRPNSSYSLPRDLEIQYWYREQSKLRIVTQILIQFASVKCDPNLTICYRSFQFFIYG